MASVKVAVVATDRDQGDGKRKVVYSITLTDNDLEDHVFSVGPKFIPTETDVAVDALSEADKLLEQQAESEAQTAEELLEDGDSLPRVLNRKWAIQKRITKRLVRALLRNREPRTAVFLEDFLQDLFDNNTNSELSTWLEIPLPHILRMRRRRNAILTDTGNAKNLIAAFDTDEGDIEDD